MNETDLIKEVEKRPILYDKSVSGFNKTKLRDDAWKDVQETLNVSEAECKKRWRSLRDSFIKLQRTHGGRTRWPYHHAMRFLLPHLEPRGDGNTSKKEEESESEDEPRARAAASLPDLGYPESRFEEDSDSQPSPKRARLGSTEDEAACQCARAASDPDSLFLVSCAPTLRRLPAKQNAVARLKIQQALYEAEFGASQLDLPYVTPASDCGFDAIDPSVQ